ncbi:ABC transporter substrate-binding protein [Pseudaminobacter arsenicus]|uniref:ABC transporter substrate-binding protein n=1 Tax=Borborobacter arsenicus TaxID=1851146 RepID=A0A432V6P5_9HYPH|nr:ABC transporter substrate-binding protein [Pseudaminobacter arsenicus]RUM97818.1 ABC transporter substrate-binding protein [Pseudaminobacter arsenicus]
MQNSSFAHQLAVSSALPRLSVGMPNAVNIGFLAPLSGQVESWGLPGLHGCRIWEDWLNKTGGLLINGRRYPIKIVEFDCGYDAEKARKGARHLVEQHDIKLLMMLGGDTIAQIRDYLTRRKLLTSTLLPSDLSPDTPYLIAPSELHPIYNVTGVEWLAQTKPELGSVAICSQSDELGLPSLATYRAAFKAANIGITKEIQYDPGTTAAAGIVQPMLDSGADILCWCTSYTPMVHAMTEYAYAKGFKGQIISCTLDYYDQLVARTSVDFMEDFVFQFPDFDDEKLTEKTFFFNRPKGFFDEYNRRFPGTWTAVSWEYVAILDIWHAAVEKCNSVNSLSVLAAMKQLGHVTHAFGPAHWWGESMFGIDNALVGDWPVVTLKNGKAKIAAFGSIPRWLQRHGDLLKQEMSNLGQLWEQRLRSSGNRAALKTRTPESIFLQK